MGEYIKVNGNSQKLGTCENLYYSTYQGLLFAVQSNRVEQDGSGNGNPLNYLRSDSGYRFRFPFPDEDGMDIGTYGNFDRGLLVELRRDILNGSTFCDGWEECQVTLQSKTQKGIRHVFNVPNPNNTNPIIRIEIVQQKHVNNKLLLCIRCPYSGGIARIEEESEIVDLVRAINETYCTDSVSSEFFIFWQNVCARIFEGYGLPYEFKMQAMPV